MRIVSQPSGGTAALSGSTATYFPSTGFEGADTFTYASSSGGPDSSLATVTVTVTAQQRPVVNPGGVTNAASFQAGAISPGELVTVFGKGMGPATLTLYDLNAASLMSRLLSGTRILFDGLPAPLIYTSAEQVTAIVPYGVAGKSATSMVVEYNGIRSSPVSLNVGTSAPGIFTAANGKGQAAALNQDGVTVNGAAQRAAAGSVIALFLTGEGAVDTALIDGQLAGATLWKPRQSVAATIGGASATVRYAGAAPGNVAGLLQVNVQVPAGTPPGDSVPVQVTIGGATTPGGVTIAVR